LGSNPVNLAFRFCLELAGLVSMFYWGWTTGTGWMRYALAFGLPLIAVTVWGIFNVPGDPSRSGKAPVVVPGWVRLLLELGYFAVAAWCLWDAGLVVWSLILSGAVVLHYILSFDRIRWLLGSQQD